MQTEVVHLSGILHTGHHLAIQARGVAAGQVETQVEAVGTGDGHITGEEGSAGVGRVRQNHFQVTCKDEVSGF